jgi:hypothetical protein
MARWKSSRADVIVRLHRWGDDMAKHRDESETIGGAAALGSTSAARIWRTVVFAGAMLVTPVAVGCGGGNKPAPAKPMPAEDTTSDKAAADQAATDMAAKEAADKQAAEEMAAKEAEAKRAADEQAAKDAEAKRAADEQAAKDAEANKPRPRTQKTRPTGRGFILS